MDFNTQVGSPCDAMGISAPFLIRMVRLYCTIGKSSSFSNSLRNLDLRKFLNIVTLPCLVL